MNHFYQLWMNAKKGANEYAPFTIRWDQVPGRDKNFKQSTIKNIGEEKWAQEFECVVPETKIKIKHKETGEIREVTMMELYQSNEYT